MVGWEGAVGESGEEGPGVWSRGGNEGAVWVEGDTGVGEVGGVGGWVGGGVESLLVEGGFVEL